MALIRGNTAEISHKAALAVRIAQRLARGAGIWRHGEPRELWRWSRDWRGPACQGETAA